MTARTPEVDPTRHWVAAFVLNLGFVGLLWAIEIADAVTPAALDSYGIRPRSEDGLWGILVAPLLHGGWGHLEGNSVPLLVLGFLVAVVSTARWFIVMAWSWVVSGLGVWLLAPAASVTIGASGLVFGLLTYLLVAGFRERSATRILVSVAVFIVYGGLLLGVLPTDARVSWQGHLFGAVGGVLAAYAHAGRRRVPARV
ncbi:rhomboid family intramembrane serine protease [Nocardioides coralli]|uniref:rhomboid family intramembrane serine protease n=1 Tax=Nocardioides coralli TaxID=2872154 RepID=UPI001CA42833|nr:rhomboid family intramembrane serine protease [Nocardioides coralli]QZY28753.1 rhomboid family intramembrane serine protease [Nocardioides coralli]